MRDYDHPSRKQLHEEVHARPPIALWPNERVLSQSFLLDANSRQKQIDWIATLSRALDVPNNSEDPSFKFLTITPEPDRVVIKWELHGEFATIAVIVHNKTKVTGPLLSSRLQIEGQLDDLLENFFIKIYRGAAIDGLSEIKKINDIFIRPILKFKKTEIINILNVEKGLKPREEVTVEFLYEDGSSKKINVLSRIDTDNETEYYKHGGILQYVLRNMA